MSVKESEFDVEVGLVRQVVNNKGYHTKLAPGAVVHPFRESAAWSASQLATPDGDLDNARRALGIILSHQETDPTRPAFGIWSYFFEESLEEMAPPDWNWADFIGESLCKILWLDAQRDGALLPDDLRDASRAALDRATRAIFRRNTQPGYTNICVLGGVVCVTAGELLGDESLIDYGQRRLGNMYRAAEAFGVVPEYNSSVYYRVGIEATETALAICQNENTRHIAEQISRWYWGRIVHSYHPATGQWCGPHSRVYADAMREEMTQFLSLRGIGPATASNATTPWQRPCPADLLELVSDAERTTVLEIPRGPTGAEHSGRHITSWMTDRRCLGSTDVEITWTQRRPLIGYAATDKGLLIVRNRVQVNGEDFASGFVRQEQDAGTVLSAFGLVDGLGAWHPGLDRPDDGRFDLRKIAFVIEVQGTNLDVDAQQSGVVIRAGGERVEVATGRASVDGADVAWNVESDEGVVRVIASGDVHRNGPTRLAELGPTFGVVGVTMSSDHEPAEAIPSIDVAERDHLIDATWKGLRLTSTSMLADKIDDVLQLGEAGSS